MKARTLWVGIWRLLPLIEFIALFGVVYLAVLLRLGLDEDLITRGIGAIWPQALLFAAVLVIALTTTGLYNRRLRESPTGTAVRIALAFFGGMLILTLFFYLFRQFFLGRGVLAVALGTGFLLVLGLRLGIARMLQRQGWWRRVLVIGAGQCAATLAGLKRRTDLFGLVIVGYLPMLDDAPAVPAEYVLAMDIRLADWVELHHIQEIVLAPDERRNNLDLTGLLECRAKGVQLTDVAAFIERETGRVNLEYVRAHWLTLSDSMRRGVHSGWAKRVFDIGISMALLIVALPVIIAAVGAIWLESRGRGPILYRQMRVGENGRVFEVLKFRSMRPDAERAGEAVWAQAGDSRITRVGHILRRYRIDELPQIWNVLRGDMTFVGPRPERPEFVDRLAERFPAYVDRHQVKPGLTGWAQISYPYGASEADAFEKLKYDLYYVKNRSLLLDLTILLHTAEVVLWGRGAR